MGKTLPPSWSRNTGSHQSGLSNSHISELVTWPLRPTPAKHSPALFPSRPVGFSRLPCYHLVSSAGAVVTPGRTRGLCLCFWRWNWAWLKVNKQLADICWVEIEIPASYWKQWGIFKMGWSSPVACLHGSRNSSFQNSIITWSNGFASVNLLLYWPT